MTEEQIKQNAEAFIKKDIKEIDDFMNNFLADLKCTRQQAIALIGLCKLCYAYGATETTKELQEENERLKKDSEENQDLATIAYMQGAGKYKAKLDEAKEIISAYIALVNRLHNVKIFNLDEELGKKAENFLKKQTLKKVIDIFLGMQYIITISGRADMEVHREEVLSLHGGQAGGFPFCHAGCDSRILHHQMA